MVVYSKAAAPLIFYGRLCTHPMWNVEFENSTYDGFEFLGTCNMIQWSHDTMSALRRELFEHMRRLPTVLTDISLSDDINYV